MNKNIVYWANIALLVLLILLFAWSAWVSRGTLP